MKHTLSWRHAAVLAVVALGACDAAPTANAGPDDDARRIAREMGLDARSLQDFGSYWLAEGDITIPKAVKPGTASAQGADPKFQYMTLNSVWTNPGSVVVDLSQIGGNPEWQAAVRTAIAAWNLPGATIRMTEGTPGDITVLTECRNDGVLGRAGFPANGRPFPTVVFNVCWVVNGWWINPTQGARAHTAVHELGHTIGFRHTNLVALGEGNGSEGAPLHITGTPGGEGDANSVMNGQSAGTEWAGLSFFDQVALLVRYPVKPVVSVTNSGGNPLVSWGAIAGATSYTVELKETIRVMDQNRNVEESTWLSPVGTTTGTSLLDGVSGWTGASTCTETVGTDRITRIARYRVTAQFPAGTTSNEAPAPITSC